MTKNINHSMMNVFEEADCLVTQKEIEQAIEKLSEEVSTRIRNSNPIILANLSGGLILSAKLLMSFDFVCELDYCHVSRYRGNTEGDELNWVAEPHLNLTDRTILIVDDMLDEGHTLDALLRYCNKKNCAEVLSVVLIDKEHDRKVHRDFKADFCGLTIPDRYVFGYGLDYKHFWRNAPGIYAVKGL